MDPKDRILQLVQQLSGLPGLSGNERSVVSALRPLFTPVVDELRVDAFGNLIAQRKGDSHGPSLMIAAHSDEVGGLVTAILPDGYLRFCLVGAVSKEVWPATRVLVGGTVIGVVCTRAGHLVAAGEPAQPRYLDIGAVSEAQVRGWGVEEGSPVVFESPVVQMRQSDRVMGKALDNRIGCALLVVLFEALAGMTIPGTLYGVVNVQEEIGMQGARMTTAHVNPTLAIILDTVPTDDIPLSQHEGDLPFQLGGGPVLQLWEGKPEQFLGTVAHPKVVALLRKTASKAGIPVQVSAAYGGWTTDGAVTHISGTGVPTGFLSIPRRYAHTPNELLDLRDAEGALHILRTLTSSTVASFRPDFFNEEGNYS